MDFILIALRLGKSYFGSAFLFECHMFAKEMN